MAALARIETGSGRVPGLSKAAALLAQRLRDVGARVGPLPADPSPGTVVGRIAGTGTRSVMPIAHHDTVRAPGTRR